MKNKERLANLISTSQKGLDYYMPYFLDLYNAYKNLLDRNVIRYLDKKGKSRVPFYLIMNKLTRINADFIEAYFTNKQFAKISEKSTLKSLLFTNRNISIAAINALQNATDYYTVEREDNIVYEALSSAFEDLQIYGTCIIKTYWDSSLQIEKIDIKDVKFDKGARNQNELKYLVHDYYKSKDEIKELIENGVFNDDVDYTRILGLGNSDEQEYKKIKLQDVYEYKEKKWIVSTIWQSDIILRESIPLEMGLPFVIGRLRSQKLKPDGKDSDDIVPIYGDSISAPLIPLQKEMTIMRNQQMDIIDKQLYPQYVTNDRSLNPFDFTSNKKLIFGKPESIRELPLPNIKDSVFNLDRLSTEAQESIGVTDYNSGVSNNKQLNSTATGISILTSESNKILQHLLRNANETLIKPLFKKLTKLVWAYGDADFFYGIDRTKKIEYQVGVDVGMGANNRQMQLNSKQTAFSGIMQLATQSQNPNAIAKAEKFYYKEILPLLGIENYEEYYIDEQEQRANENLGLQQGLGSMQELYQESTNGLNNTVQPQQYGEEPVLTGAN